LRVEPEELVEAQELPLPLPLLLVLLVLLLLLLPLLSLLQELLLEPLRLKLPHVIPPTPTTDSSTSSTSSPSSPSSLPPTLESSELLQL
jgi:hypothetical protein